MNWPDDVVEKVAEAIRFRPNIWSEETLETAQAALSSITLHDVAKLPEVKALLEACEYLKSDMLMRAEFHRHKNNGELVVDAGFSAWAGYCKALAPFTETSNG